MTGYVEFRESQTNSEMNHRFQNGAMGETSGGTVIGQELILLFY